MEIRDTYTMYGIKCADGEVDRHQIPRRTRLDLTLREAQRKDETCAQCGPHVVVQSVVTLSEWQPVADPLGEVEVAERSAAQIRADAERHRCPKCKVAPGAPCENLTARRAGHRVATSWPHRERFEVAP